MDQAGVERPETAIKDDASNEYIAAAPWKALFYFTTRRHLTVAAPAFLLSMIAGCFVPAESYLYGKVFATFAEFGAGSIDSSALLKEVDKYCVWLVALGAAAWFIQGGDFSAWTLYGAVQAANARDRLFIAMLDREMEWFDMRKHGVSALLARLNMHTMEFQAATSSPLGLVVQYLTCTVVSLGLAFFFAWDLTLITVSILPFAAIAVWFCSKHIQPNIDGQAEKLGEAAKHASNAMSSIESVKCFNGQDMELWKYTSVMSQGSKFYNTQVYWNSAQGAFLRLATLGMFVQGFWYGSHLVQTGKKDAGAVVTTFWSTMMATQAFMSIIPMVIMLEKGRMAGAKLRSVVVSIEDKPIRLIENRRPTFQSCFGQVSITNLSFHYPARPDTLILRNVSLEFPAGQLTFVIGKSGSGKSTIGQLLMRFYKFEEGHVCLDGRSINNMSLEWLRDNVFLVEQTSVLFEDTVARNIAFGRKDFDDVSENDIKAAARFASLEATIQDMPKGYETVVEAKGGNLSGGQRQRMALARARVRDPQIIILDESTSALDYINRMAVMENIRKWRRGKTTIIITHDTTQILPDDQVYLLKNGEVVQHGTRRKLQTEVDSPFQAFLHEDMIGEPAVEAIVAELKPDNPFSISPKRPPSLLSPLNPHYRGSFFRPAPFSAGLQNPLDVDDPLDTYLDQRGYLSSAVLPSVFTHHFGSVAQRDNIRPSSIISPFWRLMPSSAQLYPVGMSPTDSSPGRKRSSFGSLAGSDLKTSKQLGSATGLLAKRRSRMAGRLSAIIGSEVSSHIESNRLSEVAEADLTVKSDEFEMIELSTKVVSSEDLEATEAGSNVELNSIETLDLTSIFQTLWPQLAWSSRFLLVFSFFWLIVYAASTPLFSWIFSKLLSTFYMAANAKHSAMVYSLAILGVAVTDSVAVFLYQSELYIIGQIWVNNLRQEGFKRILDQPRQFFNDAGNEVGRMVEVLDAMAEMMQGLLGRFLPAVIVSGLMMTVAVVWSLIASWKLTLVGLAVMPIMYALTHAYGVVAGKLDNVAQGAVENVSAVFSETFSSIKTVKSLALEHHFITKFESANQKCLQAAVKRALVSGLFYGLAECSIIFVTALLFHYGAVLAANGDFSVNDIIVVFTELLFGLSNVQAILGLVPQMSACRDAASRLLRLTRLPDHNFEHEGTARVTTIGDIAFTNCDFRYPSRPDQLILNNLSITIPPGSCVALVGSSGSGKSTIASLLLKLYTTSETQISTGPMIALSGRDVKTIHTPTLRNLITVVSQTPFLFPASVADNIAYGLRKGAPQNNIQATRAAAEAAGVHHFITSLPLGYETVVGEGGLGISGGQAQRISIARALIRKPKVLILDEATSALDVESASVVRESVQRLLRADQGRVVSNTTTNSWGQRSGSKKDALTVIIITHAKEMMRMADTVLMLDKGRLVDEGGYEELLRRGGPFSRLINGEDWKKERRRIQRQSMVLMDNVAGVSPRRAA